MVVQQVQEAAAASFTSMLRGFYVVFWPWLMTYESYKFVIDHHAENKTMSMNDRVKAWYESKTSELSNVMVSGGLTAAVITGAFTWSQNKADVPEATRTAWFSALVLVLTAVTLASQQGISLNRIKTHPDQWAYLRNVLTDSPHELSGQSLEPSKVQLYVWQVPVMLLNFSNMLLILGVLILVFLTETTAVKLAVAVATAFAGINYLGSTWAVYHTAARASPQFTKMTHKDTGVATT